MPLCFWLVVLEWLGLGDAFLRILVKYKIAAAAVHKSAIVAMPLIKSDPTRPSIPPLPVEATSVRGWSPQEQWGSWEHTLEDRFGQLMGALWACTQTWLQFCG